VEDAIPTSVAVGSSRRPVDVAHIAVFEWAQDSPVDGEVVYSFPLLDELILLHFILNCELIPFEDSLVFLEAVIYKELLAWG